MSDQGENLMHVLLEPCFECCGRGWVLAELSRGNWISARDGIPILGENCPRCHGSGNEE